MSFLYLKHTIISESFHLGRYISKIIKAKKLKQGEITKMMSVQYSAFYGYESRPSSQCSITSRLCHAMKYNIFLDLANRLPTDYEYDKTLGSAKDDLIAQLQEDNKKLKWENGLLKEMIIKKDNLTII